MLKKISVLLLLILVFNLLILNNSVFALGSTTQQIVENMSSLDKPKAVPIEEECGIFDFSCLFAPKVDYTHEDLFPEKKQLKSLTFWQRVGAFFGLYKKSADPDTGYAYSYFPQNVDPATGDQNLDTDLAHEQIKETLLPFHVIQQNNNTAQTNDSGTVAGEQFEQLEPKTE